MASKDLIDNIRGYEEYIKYKGVNDKLIEAYLQGVQVAYRMENDVEYGHQLSIRTRELIDRFLLEQTGGRLRENEEYAQEHQIDMDVLDWYYKSLLFDAPFFLDSYALYIERHRPRKERFYEPRRKTLIKITDKLQDLEEDKLDELFVHQPPRTGKLIADYVPVLTSKGWKEHGNLRVGDKVVGSDGRYTKIIQVHPKFHTTHTVTFADGTKIECHADHLWKVFDRYSMQERVLSVGDMFGKEKLPNISHGNASYRYRFGLPERVPIQGRKQNLYVHPYVLGVWLGDGTSTKPCITENLEDSEHIIPKVIDCGYRLHNKWVHKDTGVPTFDFGCELAQDLREYGMCYREHTGEKFIPSEYLLGSVEQRLELLAGLIDTDGTLIKKEHRYRFSTTIEGLKDDIVKLINSFGWRASVTAYEPKLSTSGIQGRKVWYAIGFNPTFEIPCVVPRKQLKEFSKQRRITITSIVESTPVQGNCITVENEDGIYLVGEHMIPTHNSQLMTIYSAWHCARDTERSNLYATYKESLGGAFLDGCIEIWTDPTYAHQDVFSTKIMSTDAKNHKVDLGRRKKYKTLSGKGLEAGLNGEYDAKGVLIIDDILEGIQDVLNAETLKRKQIVFDNNLMSRAKEGCKIIYNGTIWSLHDIFSNRLDFLQNNPQAKHIRWDVLKLPALDPITDESNFEYEYGVGFSTTYYQTKRSKFEENDDMASWYAQYQQEPIERDGAVFNPEHMRFYNGVLPSEEPIRICCACDVALGGADFLSMPIAYVYESGDVYVDDVIFDSSEKNVTKPRVVEKIIDHNVGSAFFEANQGGEGYKDEVDAMLREKGFKLNLVSEYAPTNKRKEQRIWDSAPAIREMYFRDVGCRSNEYRKFMTNLYSFTINGKNKHEDSADSLSMLAKFIEGKNKMGTVTAIGNPFSSGGLYH